MSTRALYTFIESKSETYHVFKHTDGYPSGGIDSIHEAFPYAWLLPRFEANEFAAAFVAANKKGNGGVRLLKSGPWKKVTPIDIDYRYEVFMKGELLHVKIYSVNDTPTWTQSLMYSGPLNEAYGPDIEKKFSS